ncbi:MAG: acyl carrier protein [Microcoleus sp.]
MDKSIIFEKVKKIVAEEREIDPSEVTVNTNIVDDVKPAYNPSPSPNHSNSWLSWLPSISSSGMGLSSADMDKIEIIMALEEEFDITIPDEDAENIITVQQAVDYIFQKLTV